MNLAIKNFWVDNNWEEHDKKGGKIATASIVADDLFIIRNVNLMSGSNGWFVSMPSVKVEDKYYDYAFINENDKKALTMMMGQKMMEQVGLQMKLNTEKDIRIKMFLSEKGKQRAYATVILSGDISINRIRIMEGENGLFVSMPKVKTSKGYSDIITPASKEAYSFITDALLKEYVKLSKAKIADRDRNEIKEHEKSKKETR